jgi:O-antigen/teichoic acid export membrane protein
LFSGFAEGLSLPRSLSHQVGILTAGRFVAYAVTFFVPIVNVRALTMEHYGYYRQFWLLIDTLTPLLILGFHRSLLYYFPRAEDQRAKSVYLTQTLAFLFTMSLVAVGFYSIMNKWGGEGLGQLVRGFYIRICLFTAFTMLTHYMETLFIAEKQVGRQAVYYAVTAGLQSAIVMVASSTTRDVNMIMWALAYFALAKFAFAMGYTYVVYRPSLRLISLRTIRDQLSFALPVGLAGVALILVSQTDKFIINRFLGREEFAVYAVGAFQVPFVAIIRSSVTGVTFPLMAQYQKAGDFAAIRELWRRALLKMVVLFFPLFVFLEISARPFITVLFTEDYSGAVPIFMIYLLLFLRSSVETGNIVQAFKKTAYIAKVFSVGFVFNLWYASRLIDARFRDLFPVWELVKRLGVAVVPGALLWIAYRYVAVDNFFSLAAAGVLYFAVYFALCGLVGYVTISDIKSLFGKKPI